MGGYFAVGNEELDNMPPLHSGEAILCPKCGEAHIVKGGIDPETGIENERILYYACGDGLYLAGVAGKNIMSRFFK